jgi:hypothetical protein
MKTSLHVRGTGEQGIHGCEHLGNLALRQETLLPGRTKTMSDLTSRGPCQLVAHSN